MRGPRGRSLLAAARCTTGAPRLHGVGGVASSTPLSRGGVSAEIGELPADGMGIVGQIRPAMTVASPHEELLYVGIGADTKARRNAEFQSRLLEEVERRREVKQRLRMSYSGEPRPEAQLSCRSPIKRNLRHRKTDDESAYLAMNSRLWRDLTMQPEQSDLAALPASTPPKPSRGLVAMSGLLTTHVRSRDPSRA